MKYEGVTARNAHSTSSQSLSAVEYAGHRLWVRNPLGHCTLLMEKCNSLWLMCGSIYSVFYRIGKIRKAVGLSRQWGFQGHMCTRSLERCLEYST